MPIPSGRGDRPGCRTGRRHGLRRRSPGAPGARRGADRPAEPGERAGVHSGPSPSRVGPGMSGPSRAPDEVFPTVHGPHCGAVRGAPGNTGARPPLRPAGLGTRSHRRAWRIDSSRPPRTRGRRQSTEQCCRLHPAGLARMAQAAHPDRGTTGPDDRAVPGPPAPFSGPNSTSCRALVGRRRHRAPAGDWACCLLERHRPERAPPALQLHRVVLREPRPGGGRDGRLPGNVRGMGGPAAIPAGLRAGDRPHGRRPGAHARLPPDGSRGLQARDPAGGSALRDAAIASLGLELGRPARRLRAHGHRSSRSEVPRLQAGNVGIQRGAVQPVAGRSRPR